ncbi:MAG: DUF2946 domain-containing protein [Burkholderiaceae bacterium]
MRTLRAHRRIATSIATLAMLWAALAPALSHALGDRVGAAWVEICTTQGSRWMPSGGEREPLAPGAGLVFEHCPVCSIHTPTLGAPPGAVVTGLVAAAREALSHARPAAPRARLDRSGVQARAPPARA